MHKARCNAFLAMQRTSLARSLSCANLGYHQMWAPIAQWRCALSEASLARSHSRSRARTLVPFHPIPSRSVPFSRVQFSSISFRLLACRPLYASQVPMRRRSACSPASLPARSVSHSFDMSGSIAFVCTSSPFPPGAPRSWPLTRSCRQLSQRILG